MQHRKTALILMRTGYVAKLIFDKRSDLRLPVTQTGIIGGRCAELGTMETGLTVLPAIWNRSTRSVFDGPYRFAMTALTFHDLPDDTKQGVISFAADRLTLDGYFLLYIGSG